MWPVQAQSPAKITGSFNLELERLLRIKFFVVPTLNSIFVHFQVHSKMLARRRDSGGVGWIRIDAAYENYSDKKNLHRFCDKDFWFGLIFWPKKIRTDIRKSEKKKKKFDSDIRTKKVPTTHDFNSWSAFTIKKAGKSEIKRTFKRQQKIKP